MKIELKQALLEDREILANLLEKYDYEFSQYDGRDVNKLGLFGYQWLDCYWTDDNRWAYFIMVDNKLAGFVMICNYPPAQDRRMDFSISEFFVMYKYRRCGVGKRAFFMAADLHRGKWQLKRHPNNLTSVHFWDNAISEYTDDNFELIKSYPNTEYDDGSLADIYFFEN